jgi:hypothetical protein
MQKMMRRIWIAPLVGLAVWGCKPQEAAQETPSPTSQPSPAATSTTVATAPSPSPSADMANGSYRVQTHYFGKPNVEFSVFVNGSQVGSYNSDNVNADISQYLANPSNQVKIAWTGDPQMSRVDYARLSIQSERNGEWNDVITREVRRSNRGGEATLNIQTAPNTGTASSASMPASEDPSAMASPTPSSSSSSSTNSTASVGSSNSTGIIGDTGLDTSALSSAEQTPSSTPALAETYVVKTMFHVWAPAEFNVKVNGTEVGSFSTDSNQDITSLLKPGKNQVVVSWNVSGEPRSKYALSKMTLGVNRDGKWSTVGNIGADSAHKSGTKTFTFTAK